MSWDQDAQAYTEELAQRHGALSSPATWKDHDGLWVFTAILAAILLAIIVVNKWQKKF